VISHISSAFFLKERGAPGVPAANFPDYDIDGGTGQFSISP
jgi:hypothetical protein